MPKWLKFTLIGCGGLLGLLVLVVGCVVVAGVAGSGGSSGDKSDEKGSQSKGGADAVAIGEVATAGDVQWIVTDAQRVNELVNEGPTPKLTKTEQGSFVTVDLDFSNNSDSPTTLISTSLALIDGEGRESNPKSDAFAYIPEDRKILMENVNPGLSKQGRVIFEVPPDASDFQLQAGDTRAFGEEAYIDLGF